MTARVALAGALCEVGRRAVDLGLSPGASGNLSVRADGAMLMTPSGAGLAELRPDRLAVVDALTGAPRPESPSGITASKEVPLHAALYRRFPTAGAVVHLHSPQAMALACRRPWSVVSAIAPLTPYLVMRVGRVPLAPYAAPGTAALASSLDAVDGDFRAVLLARHGLLAWAPTISAAFDVAVEVEEGARTALLAGPDALPLDAEEIAELTDRYATPWLTTRVSRRTRN